MRISIYKDTVDSSDDLRKVPPAWLSLVDVVFVLILIPIMDKWIYPWLDRKGWSPSVFTRISIGKLTYLYLFSIYTLRYLEIKAHELGSLAFFSPWTHPSLSLPLHLISLKSAVLLFQSAEKMLQGTVKSAQRFRELRSME